MKAAAPTQRTSRSDPVRRHYDELDRFYREVWGEHVHHGLWLTGRESPEEAVRQLSRRVADHAGIGAGSRVCDVGSGYGATARLLAREYGAEVTAITLSSVQHDYAVSVEPDAANPRYLLDDWLRNDLPDGSCDAVIAIESSEHMAEKARFFAEAHRVLRPGGRLAVCAWLARRAPTRLERRFLLEPICREGRIPALETRERYRSFFRAVGFRLHADEDLTARVARTWSICLQRIAAGIVRHAHFRRYLLDARGSERVFPLTMLRVALAYRLGSMRYCLFAGVRE